MDNQSATPENLVASPASTTANPPATGPGPVATPHAGAPTPSMHLGPLPPLPGMPGSSSPFGGGRMGGGGGPLMLILVVILGLGAVIFAVLALTFYNTATKASQNLQAKESAAAEVAKAAQKKNDDE